MSSAKRKVLVTGGTGFIGRNMAEFFGAQKEYDVHATYLTRQPPEIAGVTFHKCDLRDPQACTAILKGVDILIQAAATTSGSKDIINTPSLHVTDNAVMNSYLLRAAAAEKVSHVIFFSCTVMYPNGDTTAVNENDFVPESVFPRYFGVGWTKVYIEKMCEFFSRQSSTRFTVIRHSNIYGPHDKYDLARSHVFGATVTKVMQAVDEITVWGDGQETRDLLHVEDLVQFVQLAVTRQQTPFELVNVGLGESISILHLVERIISKSGKNIQIKFDRSQPSIPTKLRLDIGKARRIFGWQPQIGLDTGIEKTLQWYRENIR